ncbi:ATP-dependent zinc metalloprotease FtsH 3 [Planctopirus ephydatiae]|uniref:ATP-dependent zinc metalloprotease FtsH 3 n=1 Tax=Planctopirus ephydatiae TaxID=2528019 RepID=A0A518GRZ0_9PLAN|nr:AAA family ATPase [Planctopirus ephydatiae]QDV31350.1 ATP-dependent zinc metalloprotease FtsH 3 [Planctopirus ephydatiae]
MIRKAAAEETLELPVSLRSDTTEEFATESTTPHTASKPRAELDRLANRDLAKVLELGQKTFGEPVIPFTLDWVGEFLLGQNSRGPIARGLPSQPPVRYIDAESHRQGMVFGMCEYQITLRTGDCRVINLIQQTSQKCPSFTRDVWLVAERQFLALYYKLRRLEKARSQVVAPLMQDSLRERLWKNTIGVLTRNAASMKALGVAIRRGMLLRGEPGNGKTMAARWLKYEAEKRRLAWKSISIAHFRAAQHRCEIGELLSLGSPGIIFFDDFDELIRRREENHNSTDICTLLNELDGIDRRYGTVFLFASNLQWNEIDHALRRPGRIDLMIEFTKPNVELRRQLMEIHWSEILRRQIDIPLAVSQTEGMSFAELEELKTLLAMQHFDEEEIDWNRALAEFQSRRTETAKKPIGFGAI